MKKIINNIIPLMILILFMTSCSYGSSNNSSAHRPDDYISKVINDCVDGSFLYQGKESLGSTGIRYDYLCSNLSSDSIREFNKALADINEGLDKPVQIGVSVRVFVDDEDTVCCFQNYVDLDEESLFTDLCVMVLPYSNINPSADYYEPRLYSNIEGVKYLEVNEIIQIKADDENIDWYDVFPDLEKVYVYDYSDKIFSFVELDEWRNFHNC